MPATLSEDERVGILEDGTAFRIDEQDNVLDAATRRPIGKLVKSPAGWSIRKNSGGSESLAPPGRDKSRSATVGLGKVAATAPATSAPPLPTGPDGKIKWWMALAPLIGAGVGAAIGRGEGALYGATAGTYALKGYGEGLVAEDERRAKEEDRQMRAGLSASAEDRATRTLGLAEKADTRAAEEVARKIIKDAIEQYREDQTDPGGVLDFETKSRINAIRASEATDKIKKQEFELLKLGLNPDGTPIKKEGLPVTEQALIDQREAAAGASRASAGRPDREVGPRIETISDPETGEKTLVQVMGDGTYVPLKARAEGLGGATIPDSIAGSLVGQPTAMPGARTPPSVAVPTDTAAVRNELKALLATAQTRPLTTIEKARVMELRKAIGR